MSSPLNKERLEGSRRQFSTPSKISKRPYHSPLPSTPLRNQNNNLDNNEHFLPTPSPQRRHARSNLKRIVVCCRKRPPTQRDGEDCVEVLKGGGGNDINNNRSNNNKNSSSNTNIEITCNKMKLDGFTPYSETFPFQFDHVFDAFSTNSAIYRRIVSPLFDFITRPSIGGRATCFAYGQTGSGKTHTMFGGADEEGICFEALRNLLKKAKDTSLHLNVSMFEIYQSQLYDLLSGGGGSGGDPSHSFNNYSNNNNNNNINNNSNIMSSPTLSYSSSPISAKRKLRACEGGDGEIRIMGLREVCCTSEREGYSLIRRGISNRQIGRTGANAQSSRSHAILQFSLKDEMGLELGRLSFIDLAGSERGADRKEVDRQTKMEGSEINKSLLALKECIRAMDMRGDGAHLPFRGSKLTFILKDSIVGPNVMTSMIATISPGQPSSEHSLNTLRYASRFMDNQIKLNDDNYEYGEDLNDRSITKTEKETEILNSEEFFDVPSSPLAIGRLESNLKLRKSRVLGGLDDLKDLIKKSVDIDLITLLGEEVETIKEAFSKLK